MSVTKKLDHNKGKQFVKADKWFASSKTCHNCGYVNEELTLSDREWVCPVCGAIHDRDENAAINIREAGSALLAW
ncbi:MAG: zinc ribbon domain-containing protein [Eubacteriales bacterium]|nr:zinc ribbon domain-containing protein [Eubacteriales bacterium]